MTEKKAGPRRWNPLVDLRPQAYLSLNVVLYFMVYSAILLLLIMIPSIVKFTSRSLPIEMQLEASREFLFLDRRVVPAILAVIFLMVLHFLYLTHRIFGPVLRLRLVLKSWKGGRWPGPFVPRQRDFHQDLFAVFNDLAGSLGSDIDGARSGIGKASDLLARAREADTEERRGDLIRQAADAIEGGRRALEKYGNEKGSEITKS